jgi:hypothetical protein
MTFLIHNVTKRALAWKLEETVVDNYFAIKCFEI